VITNAAWVATSEYLGPVIALILYAIVTFLCWRLKHFQAGIIAGILGLGIHTYELISSRVSELQKLNPWFFLINLILPIPLIYFSYKARRHA